MAIDHIIRPIYERRGCGYMTRAKFMFLSRNLFDDGRGSKKKNEKCDMDIAVLSLDWLKVTS